MGVPGLLDHIRGLLENQSILVDVGYIQGEEGQLVLVHDSDGETVLPSLEFHLSVAYKKLQSNS